MMPLHQNAMDAERDWYHRGEAYLDASYRTGTRATASEFARQFGTNRTRLTQAFRRLFGKTPFVDVRWIEPHLQTVFQEVNAVMLRLTD